MPRLDGTGLEGKGTQTGRKIGRCIDMPDEERLKIPGKGLGKKRKSGGGTGEGKRLKSGL